MGKTAAEKFARIKRTFKQGGYENVISDCKKFLHLHNSEFNYEICIYLARSHFKLYQFAQGASALEEAKNIARKRDKPELITECDALLKFEWTNMVVRVKNDLLPLDLETISNAEKMRTEMRKREYIKTLELLKNNYKNNQKDFNTQVEYINQLMNFFLQTYADRKMYIKEEYLEDSESVKSMRLKVADKMILSGLRQGEFFLLDSDSLEQLAQTEIEGYCKDIYLDDAQLLLRMIFQTIHALPRDKCKELVHLLPWGSNSWYFFSFIGSLMDIRASEFFNSMLSLCLKATNTEETNNGMSYFLSLRFCNCTLKVALLDPGFHEDLRKLRTFFVGIQANLNANGNTLKPDQLSKIEELSTLKKVVWYFKHLYNLYRLQSVLPDDITEETLMRRRDVEFLDSQHNPMNLLFKMDLMGSTPRDLKTQLAFIRRLQLIGELFTRKNWGFFLNTMDYFDPLSIINIRNALVHIEQLSRSDVIFRLEADTNRLHQLHKELAHLKTYLLEVVLKARDANFKPFPQEEQMSSLFLWLQDVTEYWESAKTYYDKQFVQFKLEDDPSPLYKENFIPGQEILRSDISVLHYRQEGRIRKQLGMHEDSNINFEVYIKYLRHVFEANRDVLTELEDVFLGKRVLHKDKLLDKVFAILSIKDPNLPIVKGLIEAAEFHSSELRKEKREAFEARHAKFEEELAKRDEVRKDIVKKKMQDSYPCIIQCAAELESELYGIQPSVSELIDTLKNRIKLLQRLFKDNGTIITAEPQGIIALQKHLAGDVSLYLATSYLVGQIISLFNKLYSLGELKEIHPDLNLLLVDYVGLRNALEHSDPFMDSEKDHQLLMSNKLPNAIAYMICEIVSRYGANIEAYSPQVVAGIPAVVVPATDAGKVKQIEAVDVNKFIDSCENRMKNFRASAAYVRPSGSGFFSGTAASPKSLLTSSAVIPFDNDPNLVVISPKFSSAFKTD